MKGYEYHKPQTVKEAIDLMEGLENAKYIAGGTDVMVLIRQKKLAPARVKRLRSADSPAMTTAIISSPPSWPTISPGTRSG